MTKLDTFSIQSQILSGERTVLLFLKSSYQVSILIRRFLFVDVQQSRKFTAFYFPYLIL